MNFMIQMRIGSLYIQWSQCLMCWFYPKLQKTNVTRDYLEDINKSSAPRMFWPREIWGKYVERLEVSMHQTLAHNPCLSLCPCFYHYPVDSMAVNLQDFKYDEHAEVAVECLNEMVTNALSHTVDCLQYMAALREITNLRFCAMPQVRKRTCLNAQFPGYMI